MSSDESGDSEEGDEGELHFARGVEKRASVMTVVDEVQKSTTKPSWKWTSSTVELSNMAEGKLLYGGVRDELRRGQIQSVGLSCGLLPFQPPNKPSLHPIINLSTQSHRQYH